MSVDWKANFSGRWQICETPSARTKVILANYRFSCQHNK